MGLVNQTQVGELPHEWNDVLLNTRVGELPHEWNDVLLNTRARPKIQVYEW